MKRDRFRWLAFASLFFLFLFILTLCRSNLRESFLNFANNEEVSRPKEPVSNPEALVWVGELGEGTKLVFREFCNGCGEGAFSNRVLNERLGLKENTHTFFVWAIFNGQDESLPLHLQKDRVIVKWKSEGGVREEPGTPLHHVLEGKALSPWVLKMVRALSAQKDSVDIPPGMEKNIVLAFSGELVSGDLQSVKLAMGENMYPFEKKILSREELEKFLKSPLAYSNALPIEKKKGE